MTLKDELLSGLLSFSPPNPIPPPLLVRAPFGQFLIQCVRCVWFISEAENFTDEAIATQRQEQYKLNSISARNQVCLRCWDETSVTQTLVLWPKKIGSEYRTVAFSDSSFGLLCLTAARLRAC